jgi:hypothetical protein
MAVSVCFRLQHHLVDARVVDLPLRHLVMGIRLYSFTEKLIGIRILREMVGCSPVVHPLLMHFFL